MITTESSGSSCTPNNRAEKSTVLNATLDERRNGAVAAFGPHWQ